MRGALMSIEKAYMTYPEGMTHAQHPLFLEAPER